MKDGRGSCGYSQMQSFYFSLGQCSQRVGMNDSLSPNLIVFLLDTSSGLLRSCGRIPALVKLEEALNLPPLLPLRRHARQPRSPHRSTPRYFICPSTLLQYAPSSLSVIFTPVAGEARRDALISFHWPAPSFSLLNTLICLHLLVSLVFFCHCCSSAFG